MDIPIAMLCQVLFCRHGILTVPQSLSGERKHLALSRQTAATTLGVVERHNDLVDAVAFKYSSWEMLPPGTPLLAVQISCST